MTIEQQVIEKLRDLPPEKQQEVLDFVAVLTEKKAVKQPGHSLRGLWKDLDVRLSEDDIAQARREMWGTSPESSPDGHGARYSCGHLVSAGIGRALSNHVLID